MNDSGDVARMEQLISRLTWINVLLFLLFIELGYGLVGTQMRYNKKNIYELKEATVELLEETKKRNRASGIR